MLNLGQTIRAHQAGLLKSSASTPAVFAAAGEVPHIPNPIPMGHRGEEPAQTVTQVAAKPAQLMKAIQVTGYTREDGTKVTAHSRTDQATKPKAKARPADPRLTEHAAKVAHHEGRADKLGEDHEDYGHHLALASMHTYALRCARRSRDAESAIERRAAEARHAQLVQVIQKTQDAHAAKKAQAQGQTIAKSHAVPVLFKKVAQRVKRIDLSRSLGEMEIVQRRRAAEARA